MACESPQLDYLIDKCKVLEKEKAQKGNESREIIVREKINCYIAGLQLYHLH